MISKMANIHISQAIKILLPREYIARCRQKRHWAARFLPGKEPLNPEHDIIAFGNVAVKRIKEGVNSFLISRVERIESIKDGAEVLSFKYCLKHEQQCFIGFKNTRRSRVFLNPIKHVLRVF